MPKPKKDTTAETTAALAKKGTPPEEFELGNMAGEESNTLEDAKKRAENAKQKEREEAARLEEARKNSPEYKRNRKAMWIGIALLVAMGLLLLLGGLPLVLPTVVAGVVGPIAGFITGFGGLGVFIALLSALMLPQGAVALMTTPKKAEFMGKIIKALFFAALAFAFPYFVLPLIAGLIVPLLGAGVPGIIMTVLGGLAHSGFYAGGSVLAYLGIVGTALSALAKLFTHLGFKTNMKGKMEGQPLFSVTKGSALEDIAKIGLARGTEIVIGAGLAALGIMVLISPLIGFALPFALPLVGAIIMAAIGSALALGLVTGLASLLPGKSALTIPAPGSGALKTPPGMEQSQENALKEDKQFSKDVEGNLDKKPGQGWQKPDLKGQSAGAPGSSPTPPAA